MNTARKTLLFLYAALVASHPLPAAAAYIELTASKLVSRPSIKFTLERHASGAREVTTLMYAAGGAEPTSVAAIEISESTRPTQIVLRLRAPARPDPELEVSTLERLYTLALQLDPEAGFCFSKGTTVCDASTTNGSHANLLRQIAMARDIALAKAKLPATPWRMVVMSPAPVDSPAPQRVSARLTLAGAPLADMRIYFNRAPHSACFAKTGPDGVASCDLVDQHGDDHDEGEDQAVVAIFTGDVTAERILPPITGIVSGGRP